MYFDSRRVTGLLSACLRSRIGVVPMSLYVSCKLFCFYFTSTITLITMKTAQIFADNLLCPEKLNFAVNV